MLDSDASFFLVPEFQSSRGARRSRSAPSTNLRTDAARGTDFCLSPLSDPGSRGVAALTAFGFSSASFMPEEAQNTTLSDQGRAIAPSALIGSTDAPAFAGESHGDDSTVAASDIPLLESVRTDSAACDAAPLVADARAITPRRPMRFTFARDAVEPGRIALPAPNLFDGVFDRSALVGPDIDPRLQRSRARAMARLAAHEATLPPEARNLWHDDGTESDDAAALTAPAIAETATPTVPDTAHDTSADISADTGPVAPRRAVRQITVTRRTPRPRPEPAALHDPLQDQLHQIRDALYAPLPEDPAQTDPAVAAAPEAPAKAPILARLVALIMALAVMRSFLTLHRALTRIPAPKADRLAAPLRRLLGGPLRLPARAAAITALVLVLAQTVPRDLM
jgi:hypothetical protein